MYYKSEGKTISNTHRQGEKRYSEPRLFWDRPPKHCPYMAEFPHLSGWKPGKRRNALNQKGIPRYCLGKSQKVAPAFRKREIGFERKRTYNLYTVAPIICIRSPL